MVKILRERKREILERWRLRVDKKLGGGALDGAALEDGWSTFLDDCARQLARSADELVERS